MGMFAHGAQQICMRSFMKTPRFRARRARILFCHYTTPHAACHAHGQNGKKLRFNSLNLNMDRNGEQCYNLC